MNLVIVESPTKAKTISRFLGDNFLIKASYGHVRDLPEKRLGVDVKHDFKPEYVILPKSRNIVKDLKLSASQAEKIYFATDEDREGEAISWHLAEILKLPKEKIHRITFHEVTKEAIEEALRNPRSLDLRLVNAQQARRILDRLVGYELSPFLWRKVARGLSAGRVQSVAVRLIVEREREIQAFKPQEYWTIEALLKPSNTLNEGSFTAKLSKINNVVLDKFDIPTQAKAERIIKELDGASYFVSEVQKRETRRSPLPPFTTSTLQQEANHRLGFSAKQTMLIAQQLYEGVELGEKGSTGLITYMRTDSVNLAEKFLNEARSLISRLYGEKYLPDAPRRFITKSKLAQEAHEAIRPTEVSYTPESIKQYLKEDQWKLYDLIWRRAVACQMKEAILEQTTIEIEAIPSQKTELMTLSEEKKDEKAKNIQEKNKFCYTFRAVGSVIKFDGFLKIYGEAKEEFLPQLQKGESLTLLKIESKQHFTEPPARYSDASLVKALEEYGIGRPSTYAPTISTIIERKYVERIEGKRLKPTEMGILVNDLLVTHFPEIVDYQFTAKIEADLDDIAQGKKEWIPVIRNFYEPFKANLNQKYQEVKKKDIIETPSLETCDKCGGPMVLKIGRFGKFLACSAFPKCRNLKPLKEEKILKGVICPKCNQGSIIERKTKKGRLFYSCSRYPDCNFALWNKPTGEKCSKCGALLIEKKGKIICSNKNCDSQETENK
jgi:DNA topoisomerase-1